MTSAAPLGPAGQRMAATLASLVARCLPIRLGADGARERRIGGLLLCVERDLDDGRVARDLHAGRLLRSEELLRAAGRLVRHGALVEWSREGKALATSTWRMGVPHGPSRQCWPNGRLRAHGSWVDGRKDGEWWHAHADGRLDRARTGLWREGARIGGIKGFNDWLGSP